jgi:hypothetical protein
MLVRIVAMRTKLVGRFDPYQYRMRENAPSLAGPFEHEDDDEHEDDWSGKQSPSRANPRKKTKF